MVGHAIANSRQGQQLLAVGGEFLDRFRQAVQQFRRLLVAAKPANHGPINFQQLRCFAQNARDFAVLHKCSRVAPAFRRARA